MSWLDAVFGRDKPIKSSLEQLFGLSTAQLTLQTECGMLPSNAAAISFRPVGTGEFARLKKEIEELLAASTRDAPLTWNSFTDSYGFQWIVLRAEEFENLVATVHMVSNELKDAQFGEQLLASVFQFREENGRSIYWIYNYKRGAFYPFVPAGNQARDNATELRLSSVMSGELHVETDLTKWYALWGIPLDS